MVVAGVVIAWRESELAGFKFRARYNVDNGKPPDPALAPAAAAATGRRADMPSHDWFYEMK